MKVILLFLISARPETYIVSDINTIDLNNIFEDMIYKDDLSNKYVSVIKSKLNLLFSYAMKKGYVEKNPIDEVVLN
ncbi:hypothetical protein EfmGK961_09380 [Enterococcus faecium]|nr:hypothetical protein EfmGK961_09380 [Enterococcus faecium]